MTKQQIATEVEKLIKQQYPNPQTELVHSSEMELAIAVMLSAQTTDKKVNEITKTLFKKYKKWEDFASADLTTLQADIKGVNFHLGKAERIIKMARMVLEKFSGNLPHSVSELVTLPGIARKSANVIQQELWNIAEGIVVDTHITRVSNRLTLTDKVDAVKIEQELMTLFSKDSYRNISGGIVLHGRYICKARKPECGQCILNKVCPSAFKLTQ